MRKNKTLCLLAALCLAFTSSQAQSADSVTEKISNFPSRLFGRIQRKTADLDRRLTRQTEKYLQKMSRREERMREKLYKRDSVAAKALFGNSPQQYTALARRMKTDTGSRNNPIAGEYLPYSDTLRGSLAFLQQNSQLLGTSANITARVPPQLQNSIEQLQALQAKMNDADQVKAFIRQRKEQIGNYISLHADLAGALGKQYQGLDQDVYYYSQQVRQYKEMLNDPDKLEQQALALLNKLPSFQTFMKNNSQLAGLFNLPSNYGTAAGLAGLQTRDQVSSLVQGQVSAGGAGGAAALQSNLQSAESQLDEYKDKLGKLGGGSGDMDLPNFTPNRQKTKSFWKRLELGTNFQTTRTNYYYPNTADLGLSIGYKLGNGNTIGIGASYNMGLGNGWNHISLTSNGVGLRSFLDVRLKGSFSATGGLEYNYATPFTSLQQLRQFSYWTQSGLIGVTKTVSMKTRVFKKTKLSLLWDFLSYQQIPKTQPIIFRVGYNF